MFVNVIVLLSKPVCKTNACEWNYFSHSRICTNSAHSTPSPGKNILGHLWLNQLNSVIPKPKSYPSWCEVRGIPAEPTCTGTRVRNRLQAATSSLPHHLTLCAFYNLLSRLCAAELSTNVNVRVAQFTADTRWRHTACIVHFCRESNLINHFVCMYSQHIRGWIYSIIPHGVDK